MVNKNKTHRLMVQVTVNQYNWLLAKAESLDISISQLVRWLLNKKIKDINDIQKLNTKPKETTTETIDEDVTQEEWDDMMKELQKPIKVPLS